MKKNIILVGAGYYGRQAIENLKDYNVIAVADNNADKIGRRMMEIPVISVSQINTYIDDETDIVLSTIRHRELSRQLENMGINNFLIMLDGHVYQKPGDGFRRCNRCVMDNWSDETIVFDSNGYCNYCNSALDQFCKVYFPNDKGKDKLNKLISKVKMEGKDKKYDCIMGISGGLDSSYLAYLGYKWGLRILCVHIDDGYDTDTSKNNIKALIKKTGFDYEVIKPDSVQFNDLTLAYMKAGVPNIAVPQDNVLFAFIYKKMRDNGIKYFFSGGNFALESILQKGNTYTAYDIKNILDIHRRFGKEPIDKLELLSAEQKKHDENELGIESPRPLNYIEYKREEAFKELKVFCGFEYYGSKHLENILTAFIQLYWFPKKFGVDKRTSHLSSMIVSDQMTREEALTILKSPIYEENLMQEYIDFIMKQMKIEKGEFDEIMSAPVHQHEDYEHEA